VSGQTDKQTYMLVTIHHTPTECKIMTSARRNSDWIGLSVGPMITRTHAICDLVITTTTLTGEISISFILQISVVNGDRCVLTSNACRFHKSRIFGHSDARHSDSQHKFPAALTLREVRFGDISDVQRSLAIS